MRLTEKEAWESLADLFSVPGMQRCFYGILLGLYYMRICGHITATKEQKMAMKVEKVVNWPFSLAGDRKRAEFCRRMAEECKSKEAKK